MVKIVNCLIMLLITLTNINMTIDKLDMVYEISYKIVNNDIEYIEIDVSEDDDKKVAYVNRLRDIVRELSGYEYEIHGTYNSGYRKVKLEIGKEETLKGIEKGIEDIQLKVNEVSKKAQEYKNVKEQVEYVNRYLIENVDYDLENENAWSAYGSLLDGRAVCSGYANAFTLIMEELGIPVVEVVGYNNKSKHNWNKVYIDGEWLNIDVTFNDSTGDIDRYLYLTDAEMVELGYTFNSVEVNKVIEYKYRELNIDT